MIVLATNETGAVLVAKRGQQIVAATPQIMWAMQEADRIFGEAGVGDVRVLYVLNGKHVDGSAHYEGNAFDARTRHLPLAKRDTITRRLQAALGPDYQVMNKSAPPHLHVEWDPRGPLPEEVTSAIR